MQPNKLMLYLTFIIIFSSILECKIRSEGKSPKKEEEEEKKDNEPNPDESTDQIEKIDNDFKDIISKKLEVLHRPIDGKSFLIGSEFCFMWNDCYDIIKLLEKKTDEKLFLVSNNQGQKYTLKYMRNIAEIHCQHIYRILKTIENKQDDINNDPEKDKFILRTFKHKVFHQINKNNDKDKKLGEIVILTSYLPGPNLKTILEHEGVFNLPDLRGEINLRNPIQIYHLVHKMIYALLRFNSHYDLRHLNVKPENINVDLDDNGELSVVLTGYETALFDIDDAPIKWTKEYAYPLAIDFRKDREEFKQLVVYFDQWSLSYIIEEILEKVGSDGSNLSRKVRKAIFNAVSDLREGNFGYALHMLMINVRAAFNI